ncbi:MAG: hypothetical protein WD009_12565 [Phycisphaeraceae bacterium]
MKLPPDASAHALMNARRDDGHATHIATAADVIRSPTKKTWPLSQ